MDTRVSRKLEQLRIDFARVSGEPFRHFACPMLFRDEDVPLCRAHIVNAAFQSSSRRWTIQRQDVDNFYGSTFEADFADVQHNAAGLAPKALIDRNLHRRLRPKISLRGTEVEYFVGNGPVPSDFTPVRFGDEREQIRLALKMNAADVASAEVADWQITVEKDLSLAAVVSVVKAAHLTLFAMFGYTYALSLAGQSVGAQLGSFYDENHNKRRPDVLAAAATHFASCATLVRPIKTKASPLRGTIEDGYAQMCWLEGSNPERPWAMIVFVRTAQVLSAALIPMFDDQTGVSRFGQLLERGEDRLVTSMVRFKGGQWHGDKHRRAIDWPAAVFKQRI